ncbi:MAG: SDR family oxidoreductase [Micrococcales bacterium]|nr:SDR family oxidoreductase [Micrococcales bacterium]
MSEVQNRGVLVTGSSRGVGAAVAAAFAARGDRVVVHYRGADELAEAVLAGLPGTGHSLVKADLADPQETQRLAAEAIAALGRVDILVNNAAMFLAPEDLASGDRAAQNGSRRGDHRLTEVDYEAWVTSWQRTLSTNLLGPANLTYLVARHMIDGAGGGRIVNVGSRGAYRGEPDVPAYGASKAALHAFGQSMAIALAPHGIGVASIAPGFIATDMAVSVLDGPEGDAVRAQSPFGRVATVQEVAAAVVALTDPLLLWASGAVLDFNGASYLR